MMRARGYVLLTVVFLAALVLVALSAAVPGFYTQGQRELEEELIFRGKQYQRAIGLHFRKTGRFPLKVEDLLGENQAKQRFLRKAWGDPVNKEGKWRFIRVGPAGQLFGSVTGRTQLQRQGGRQGGRAGGRQPGRAALDSDGEPDAAAPPKSSEDSAFFKKAEDEMEHLPFAGVASRREKEGIKEIDGYTQYNEWEFIFDPVSEALQRRLQGGTGGQGRPRTPGRPDRPRGGGGDRLPR